MSMFAAICRSPSDMAVNCNFCATFPSPFSRSAAHSALSLLCNIFDYLPHISSTAILHSCKQVGADTELHICKPKSTYTSLNANIQLNISALSCSYTVQQLEICISHVTVKAFLALKLLLLLLVEHCGCCCWLSLLLLTRLPLLFMFCCLVLVAAFDLLHLPHLLCHIATPPQKLSPSDMLHAVHYLCCAAVNGAVCLVVVAIVIIWCNSLLLLLLLILLWLLLSWYLLLLLSLFLYYFLLLLYYYLCCCFYMSFYNFLLLLFLHNCFFFILFM